MPSWSRSVVVACGVFLGTTPVAHAALNFCFNPGTTILSTLAVAEKFKKPARGSCSPINGFDLVRTPQTVTGTACLNSVGDTLRVSYTVDYFARLAGGSLDERYPVHVHMIIPYPALAGGFGAAHNDEPPGTSETSQNAHANPCIPSSPTVP
jgi:hypothetical protein